MALSQAELAAAVTELRAERAQAAVVLPIAEPPEVVGLAPPGESLFGNPGRPAIGADTSERLQEAHIRIRELEAAAAVRDSRIAHMNKLVEEIQQFMQDRLIDSGLGRVVPSYHH